MSQSDLRIVKDQGWVHIKLCHKSAMKGEAWGEREREREREGRERERERDKESKRERERER